jgi:hypothetical protein
MDRIHLAQDGDQWCALVKYSNKSSESQSFPYCRTEQGSCICWHVSGTATVLRTTIKGTYCIEDVECHD